MSYNGEDGLPGEVDEPLDEHIRFTRVPPSHQNPIIRENEYTKSAPPVLSRRESLLTRGLLTSPEFARADNTDLPLVSNLSRALSTTSTWSNASAASTADLTSDGGLTSPARTNTPSPPLPQANFHAISSVTPKPSLHVQPVIGQDGQDDKNRLASPEGVAVTANQESTVEAGLGRKRCIRFACGRSSSAKDTADDSSKSEADKAKPAVLETSSKAAEPPKRACMLKFVCPMRPSQENMKEEEVRGNRMASPPPMVQKPRSLSKFSPRTHRDSESTIRNSSPPSVSRSPVAVRPKPIIIKEKELERSEATRFHEFASSIEQEDEWTQESTVHRHKITVNDTLRKENAFRQLGEEIEEEALQEEEEEDLDDEARNDEDEDEDEDVQDLQNRNIDELSSDEISDGGNETDNEEGFADSDDESDAGSDYQFWTPAGTTAATSTDHVDLIRYTVKRSTSESSLDSMHRISPSNTTVPNQTIKAKKPSRRSQARPSTPDLPDSTDFVCGTLDEDRPLEDAYVSCLEERRRAKHAVIPQDIDPSFPTSDLEDQDDHDDDEESEEHLWIKGQLDDYEDGAARGRKRSTTSTRKSPIHSPKRLQSPPPPKKAALHRSPPPRRLFGQSPKRMRSPPPSRHLKSPPSTRQTSMAVSPIQQVPGINFATLGHRPNLTHTKSLPRTPHLFVKRYGLSPRGSLGNTSTNSSPLAASVRKDSHSRGAIDIVKGLEGKRQRCKEKVWQKHCRNAAKEPRRKPMQGKGAERMRELGLEMAGKGKGGIKQSKAEYVLSV
ncbi:MAG: hypothetical protein M1827_000921 [Pycnora praestabilis]|nr:MAG: hypothetical protein M1827_000921 [Pycnora praestabilis]